MKSDVASLKDNNEMLSQQLSRGKSKFNNLEIKLNHTRDSLREKILMLPEPATAQSRGGGVFPGLVADLHC